MPLPLLLLPLVATASGTSVGAIVSASVGSFILGGGSVATWLWWSSNPTPSSEHQKSQDKQAQMLQTRIKEMTQALDSTQKRLTTVGDALLNTTTSTSLSATTLEQIPKELDRIRIELNTTIQMAQDTKGTFSDFTEQLKKLSEQIKSQTIKDLDAITLTLLPKENDITKAHEQITVLKNTLNDQVSSMKQLEEVIKILTKENELQNLRILKQQKTIETLEPQLKKLLEQNSFFRKIVQQLVPASECDKVKQMELK